MTEHRDPALQALFTHARQDLPDDAFTASVMVRVDRLKRQRSLSRFGIDLFLVLCAWLLAEPLQSTVFLVMPSLTSSLIQLDNQLLADILLPINNVASIIVLSVIALRSAYRRMFS
jgi:hypothetical protein